MSVNSGGSKQLPLLLQSSKLPPINELLKTSVGLLRPVNLGNLNNSNFNNAGSHSISQMPQQAFRYPYGMPLNRPMTITHTPAPVPVPSSNTLSQSQPLYSASSQNQIHQHQHSSRNGIRSQQPGQNTLEHPQNSSRNVPTCGSRIIVVQEPSSSKCSNSVLIVQGQPQHAPPRSVGAAVNVQNHVTLQSELFETPTIESNSSESFIVTNNFLPTTSGLLSSDNQGMSSVVPATNEIIRTDDIPESENAAEKKSRKKKIAKYLGTDDIESSTSKRSNSSSPNGLIGVKKKRFKKAANNRASPNLVLALGSLAARTDAVSVDERLGKELAISKESELILQAELENVREALSQETHLRDTERNKYEASCKSMIQELSQLKSRIQTAEAKCSSLERNNLALKSELFSLKTQYGLEISEPFDEEEEHQYSLSSMDLKFIVDSLKSVIAMTSQSDTLRDITAITEQILNRVCRTNSQSLHLDDFNVSGTFSDCLKNQNGRSLRSNIKGTLATVEECGEASQDLLNSSAVSSGGCLDDQQLVSQNVEGHFKVYCPKCPDFSTDAVKSLLIHLGRKHQTKLEPGQFSCKRGALARCIACQKTSKDYLTLAVHYMQVHFQRLDTPYSLCQFPNCGFSAPQQFDLIQHLASVHLMSPENIVSTVVSVLPPKSLSSDTLSSLSSGSSASSRPTSASSSSVNSGGTSTLLCICKHCPYRTERYTDMRKHALRRHGDETAFERREATEADPEVSLACGVCTSRFFRPGDLKRHRTRYNHFLNSDNKNSGQLVKPEPEAVFDMVQPLLEDVRAFEKHLLHSGIQNNRPKFIAPTFNLAARVHAKLLRRFLLLKRKQIRNQFISFHLFDPMLSLKLNPSFMPHFGVDEVADLLNEAPPSPELNMLISNSDIKTLCDFPGDVEKLLGD